MKQFYTSLRESFGVHENELTKISEFFTENTLTKGSFLTKTGQYCNQLIFLQKGFFRVYSVHHEKEITQWVAPPGYFLTDLSSFMFDQRSRWNIEAIDETQFLSISKEKYLQLKLAFTNWDALEKRFISHCFIHLEERVNQLISMNSEERYFVFFENNRELFNQVPLQYLASMLGMTAETMSRIRRKQLS